MNSNVYAEFDSEQLAWSVASHDVGLNDHLETAVVEDERTSKDSILETWAMGQLFGIDYLQTQTESANKVPARTLPERVASILLFIGEQNEGIIEGLDRQALSKQLGTQRETVNAILRTFHRQNIIRIQHRHIEIVDSESLAELAWF